MNIIILLITILLVLVFWLAWGIYGLKIIPFITNSCANDIATAGQFGDMFGVLTSLFSGLGFIGVIYTIHLQTAW